MNSEIYFKYGNHSRHKYPRRTVNGDEVSRVRGDLLGLKHIVKERQEQNRVPKVEFSEFVRYVIDEAALG